ncbi:MAG: hypothetical protein JOZ19_01835 [Rubrobacter sp.]|nr:hypothetical protein [Rubrobacter sp.]
MLEETAAALEEGDSEQVQRALTKARAIDARVSDFKEAFKAGCETVRLAPPRRRVLGHLELYVVTADQIDQPSATCEYWPAARSACTP